MFCKASFFTCVSKVLLNRRLGDAIVWFILLDKQSIRRLIVGKPVFSKYIERLLGQYSVSVDTGFGLSYMNSHICSLIGKF